MLGVGRSLVPAAGRFVLADCREANLISGERVETRRPAGAAFEISPVLLRITAFGSARSLNAEMTRNCRRADSREGV